MSRKKIGEVAGSDVFWDEDTGEVYVGINRAGNAPSKDKALNEARNYINNRNPIFTDRVPPVES